MPERYYVLVDGQRALLVVQFGRFLRNLAEQAAAGLGERLHSAEFVLTTDPAVVESRGLMHDCDECRAGVRRALRVLRDEPGVELIVGTVYWADPSPGRDAGTQGGS